MPRTVVIPAPQVLDTPSLPSKLEEMASAKLEVRFSLAVPPLARYLHRPR